MELNATSHYRVTLDLKDHELHNIWSALAYAQEPTAGFPNTIATRETARELANALNILCASGKQQLDGGGA